MYLTVLTLHSWNRWLALALAIAATINAFVYAPHVIDGRPRGSKWDTFFMAAIDLQVLLGLLLYFGLSPYSTEAMSNPSGAMKSASLRFWGFEHEILALGSMIAVRLGRIFATRGSATPESRQRRRLVCFAVALVTMLVAAFAERRPWFRTWPG